MSPTSESSQRAAAPGRPVIGVIASKLTPHRLPQGSVSRPRLTEVLRSGRGRALTLVSAPAGYGKTTLLAEWIASGTDLDTTFVWVSLDVGDQVPARLWTHVMAALGKSEPEVGQRSMPALRTNPDRISETVLPVLFDEIAAGSGHVVLVLDDFHLAESSAVIEQVQTFLTYRPERLQLVVSTRSDPALGVARLRASGELVEIRADSLRFDAPELSDFFKGVGVRSLSRADERRLAERTGGWPAPLRLAALLIPDQGRESFLDSFTGGRRQVVDYLTGDVLDLLKPQAREFVLQVSILDRMNGPLCDAVTAGFRSGELLAELERANLFVSTDVDAEWYRQHHLFAEALRLELARTRPELVPLLHARAAAWFAGVGDLETATEHAIAARDVGLAARLVADQMQPISASGRSATTRRWLDALGWPEALRDPELALVRGVVASIDSSYADALGFFDLARSGPPEQLDAAGLPLAFRADMMEGMVGVTEVSRAEAAARRAVLTAPTAAWEGVAWGGVGQSLYLQGDFEEAARTLRRAVGLITDATPMLLAQAVGVLGLAESALDGPSSRADPMLDDMLEVLSQIGVGESSICAVVHLAAGERDRRAGDLRSAVARYGTAIELLEALPRNTWLALAYLLRASVHRAIGDPRSAVTDLDIADEVLARIPDPGDLRQRAARLNERLTLPVRLVSEFGEQLSERELDVLRLAATGIDQRQIAEQLFISYNTVKSHLKTTYRKLGVSSRAEAVALLRAADGTTGHASRSPG